MQLLLIVGEVTKAESVEGHLPVQILGRALSANHGIEIKAR
jgi:hypothetical protein